jgi:hypothetical protein
MKHGFTLLLLMILTTPLTVLAEDEKPAMSDEKMNKMQENLQLTDEQLAEMRQIRADGGSNKEIRAVLDDEQKAQAKKMKNERKEKKVAKEEIDSADQDQD